MTTKVKPMPRLRNASKGALIAAALLALGGCVSLLDATSSPPSKIYTLDAAQASSDRGADLAFLVGRFSTPGALALDRIAVRSDGNEIAYLSDARWSDELGAMVQTLVTNSILNASAASAGPAGSPFTPSHRIAGIIESFTLNRDETDGETDRVDITFTAQLVDARNGRLVSQRRFSASMPVSGSGNRAVVAAFDTALQPLLAEMASWAVATAERPAA